MFRSKFGFSRKKISLFRSNYRWLIPDRDLEDHSDPTEARATQVYQNLRAKIQRGTIGRGIAAHAPFELEMILKNFLYLFDRYEFLNNYTDF